MGPKTKRKILVHLIEFFVLGVVMGVSEDLIAIHFATDARITWDIVKVALLIAIPFAIISEVLTDSKIFWHLLNHSKNKRKKN